MPALSKHPVTVRCSCGSVEFEALGEPILSAVCHCDDCQRGARQIEGLPQASPVLDPYGGTEYVLYRKDRFRCVKGAAQLCDYKLRDASPTRRVVAGCCNTAMFLDFQKGHWYSVYRARLGGDGPPPEVRIQTRFKPEGPAIPDDVRSYSTYPLWFIGKLMLARAAMLFSRTR